MFHVKHLKFLTIFILFSSFSSWARDRCSFYTDSQPNGGFVEFYTLITIKDSSLTSYEYKKNIYNLFNQHPELANRCNFQTLKRGFDNGQTLFSNYAWVAYGNQSALLYNMDMNANAFDLSQEWFRYIFSDIKTPKAYCAFVCGR